MRNNNAKLTEAQRELLVNVYLKQGTRAAGLLAVKMGVCWKYPGNMAATRGKRRTAHRTRNDSDPRWEWAIERGPVIA